MHTILIYDYFRQIQSNPIDATIIFFYFVLVFVLFDSVHIKMHAIRSMNNKTDWNVRNKVRRMLNNKWNLCRFWKERKNNKRNININSLINCALFCLKKLGSVIAIHCSRRSGSSTWNKLHLALCINNYVFFHIKFHFHTVKKKWEKEREREREDTRATISLLWK